ncbi:NADPH-dependent glutamate synthase beta chain [Granulicatella balaenopterae]|uniref:NADPH-dependent glutamate synthase beta chain n=1 Tax=Granulicatella balaenopterae TaxID=137733 RepID=A0A1H9PG92_9LACT|nr:FAD-dependent oxidoreductase [Granulicatella balaenopterae]SER46869.1 NADPH-dependent glutamate synthase beta chain [Granulicatella balaenopterae]
MLDKQVIKNMEELVDGCMGEETAACQATCPMHTDVKEYIRLIRDGEGTEAIKVIRDKLFLPGSLGRICAHPCEAQCKWNEGKSPMAIASLKRYAADNFDEEGIWDLTTAPETGKKVAVIGAGPSGLQAAIDLRRQGIAVTIFEKLPVRGGMLAVGIPAYRLPRHVLEHEITYLDKLGVEFKMNCEIGKDVQFDEIINEFDSVVVAVGKHQGRVDRNLENWDAKGIFSAAEFLKEAALTGDVKEAGTKALVIGGGDVAMDCARTAARVGSIEKVYSACLEDSFDHMFASNHEIKGAIDEGVSFNHAQAIKTIHKDENGRVSGVTMKECLGMFDAEGRFSPQFNEDKTFDLTVDTIVFAIGQGVDAEFAGDALEQRRNSTFECDPETLQANTNEKIFVTGDASGESVIAIQAMATGRRAAESVRRYLNNEDLREGRNIDDTKTYTTKLDMPTNWDEIEGTRMGMAELPARERIQSFEEVLLGYTADEAHNEADRCRQCECRLCMTECIMMNDYASCPKALFREYLEKGHEKMDKMIAYSCNECSQCTLVCPKSYDIRENFMGIKRAYAEENDGVVAIDELLESEEAQVLECADEYCTTVPGKNTDSNLPSKEVVETVVETVIHEVIDNVIDTVVDAVSDERCACGKKPKSACCGGKHHEEKTSCGCNTHKGTGESMTQETHTHKHENCACKHQEQQPKQTGCGCRGQKEPATTNQAPAQTPKKKKKTKYVYAPGCTVSALSPEANENILRHLKDSLGEENVGAMLRCCGKVTGFLGENAKFDERNAMAIDELDEMGAEVIITVCPSCYKVFGKTNRNQRMISYWDLMHDLIGLPEGAKGIGKDSDIVFNIHDSCVTRDVSSHHESIRWMLDEMGYKWEEIERNGMRTRCCGVGGMVCSSNPELYERVYTRRVNDFNQNDILTYCGSCNGTMMTAGKNSVHILNLLFGDTYMKADLGKRPYDTTEEMWENRLATKERFEKFKD